MATTALQLTATPGKPHSFAPKAALFLYLLDIALTDVSVTALSLSLASVTGVTAADTSVTGLAMNEAIQS